MITQLPTASLTRRFGAMLYEALLLLALLFIADYLFISLTHNAQTPLLKTVLQLYLLSVVMIYFSWFWTRGQSLAMKTWHIRIVTVSGKKLKPHQALIRFLLATALFGISQVWAIFDRDHQFLHDRLNGTRLVAYVK
ncbi:MAG: RDD family protein [Sulfuriferula sp.]